MAASLHLRSFLGGPHGPQAWPEPSRPLDKRMVLLAERRGGAQLPLLLGRGEAQRSEPVGQGEKRPELRTK